MVKYRKNKNKNHFTRSDPTGNPCLLKTDTTPTATGTPRPAAATASSTTGPRSRDSAAKKCLDKKYWIQLKYVNHLDAYKR